MGPGVCRALDLRADQSLVGLGLGVLPADPSDHPVWGHAYCAPNFQGSRPYGTGGLPGGRRYLTTYSKMAILFGWSETRQICEG